MFDVLFSMFTPGVLGLLFNTMPLFIKKKKKGYRIINELGDAIIGIATTYDLILTNIWFKERGNQI